MWGIMAEAVTMAIADAGIRKEDIDGVMTFGAVVYPAPIAEWLGIKPRHLSSTIENMGSSSGNALMTAAALIDAGVCKYVLGVFGGQRDAALSNVPGTAGMSHLDRMGPSVDSEFAMPYGPTVAANNSYGWMYTRHMHEYGTNEGALWNMSVNQRYNTMNNPRSAFRAAGTITLDDVKNSRYINYPLHILESVMPVAGAAAYIVTSADLAKASRKPVYILGIGFNQGSATAWINPQHTTTPTKIAARDAYRMAGVSWRDIQFTEFYD